jgi:hypothetical protein
MENKRLERGLEKISNIFLSAGEKAENASHGPENQYEIEETVTVRKKLFFYNHTDVQQNIKKSLARHLEEGYQLIRVCLQKNETVSKSKSQIHSEEEVIISIK